MFFWNYVTFSIIQWMLAIWSLVLLPFLSPAYNSSSLAFLIMCSAYRLNKQGDSRQPCHTPFLILNQSVIPYRVLTCFLTHIQVSQETGKSSHLFKSFPQFVMIHSQRLQHSQWNRSRCFFGNSLGFSMIQQMLAIWSLVLLPFRNPAWASGSSWFM